MTQDPQSLYIHLGRLIEAMPDLRYSGGDCPAETYQWLGRACVLVEEAGDLMDAVRITSAVSQLNSAAWETATKEIHAIVYRVLARAEMKAPAIAGGFIPVGNHFDAFAAISKILQTAKEDTLIVDPYMDEKTLTDFGLASPEGIPLRLMADASFVKASLAPAAKSWIAQYGATRPLEVRLAAPRSLHDRAIFVDHAKAWTLTQSLNKFAERSPAEIIRADDTASLKIPAYEAIWETAAPLR